MTYRVGFLTTHPIQYQVPIFRELARTPDLDLTVFFCQLPDDKTQGNGFGLDFQWDVPLLDGYSYVVLSNVSPNPSVTEFNGCDTPEIANYVRSRPFDAFIVNGWVVRSCLQTLRACRRHSVPCVVRGEANLLRPRPWWKHLLHRRLVRKYAAHLYIGKANRAFYESHGIGDEQLFFAPYCVENERFANLPDIDDRRTAMRRQLGIPDDVVCFLFSGKFVPKKHPLELLRAFSAAIRRGANAHLLMTGDGELRTRCEQFVDEQKWPVAFSGFLNQSRMPDAYAAADCLVLPSDHGETWGLVVNEAMACGRPAIVSNLVGCAADLVLEDRTGAIFPFGDWARLTDILVEFTRNPSRIRSLGISAREHVSRYSVKAAAEGVLHAVQSVCGKRVQECLS
jgi:glycosyltransferase involved in cell wall biosynthesis